MFNIKEWERKIENTGSFDKGSSRFKHLSLRQDELTSIFNQNEVECILMQDDESPLREGILKKLKVLSESLRVDWITLKRTGPVQIAHISSVDREESIRIHGLVSSGMCMALGKGVSAIQADRPLSVSELKWQFMLKWRKPEVLLIRGRYVGDYLECIFGMDKLGELLLLRDVPPEDISEIKVVDYRTFFYSDYQARKINISLNF